MGVTSTPWAATVHGSRHPRASTPSGPVMDIAMHSTSPNEGDANATPTRGRAPLSKLTGDAPRACRYSHPHASRPGTRKGLGPADAEPRTSDLGPRTSDLDMSDQS